MIKISFIIPTLNAEKVLEKCLKSIRSQKYPKKNYEIIIADGGSTDKTLKIAQKYRSTIINNPLKTAEAGKAFGIKSARGQFIALIDSDNILPHHHWLSDSLLPFIDNPNIIGSEPIKFTYRKNSGIFERYSALLGANDPYAFIIGVYDRISYVNLKWTGLKMETKDFPKYKLITLKPFQPIPTIGANGTIFRKNFIQKFLTSNYLFDIDLISQALKQKHQNLYFAKTKIGIIHTFCESSLKKFIKKQKRRLIDYYQYKDLRKYDWASNGHQNQLKFILYTIFILPALFDSIKGFCHKPDKVWFIHPFICLITLYIYSIITIKYKLGLLKPVNRSQWQQ